MKTFILCLDGLEHNFVEEWDLTHLKQFEYGRIEVPISIDKKVPYTPEVWASFLTGKNMCLDFKTTVMPLTVIIRILGFFRSMTKRKIGIARKLRQVAPTSIYGYRNFSSIKGTTFLDLIDSKRINFPYYNYDSKPLKLLQIFANDKITIREYEKSLILLYNQRKKQIIQAINGSPNENICAFMHFPDVLQHLYFSKPKKIKELYMDLNHYVFSLKHHLKNRTTLIVSDHGFDLKTEEHSMYGFYSSGIKLSPKPTKIIDFHQIITEYLGMK